MTGNERSSSRSSRIRRITRVVTPTQVSDRYPVMVMEMTNHFHRV
jgi:hypothetical protein